MSPLTLEPPDTGVLESASSARTPRGQLGNGCLVDHRDRGRGRLLGDIVARGGRRCRQRPEPIPSLVTRLHDDASVAGTVRAGGARIVTSSG